MTTLDRTRLRPHALDGELLFFQPSSGESVRVRTAETRGLARTAPRVVLFGLSHACNLTCGFCSRDAENRARWSPDDALSLLRDLSDAGTLEVAFGGGEPLAYAGFASLVRRLAEATPLAIHFTTNGVLLDDATARQIAPYVGQVRVSLHDGQPWEAALERLVAAGVRAGANLIVTPEVLGALPGMLARLATLGCEDVALLRYVGPTSALHLRGYDWARLELAVAAAPLPVLLSRCFADRLPGVPRLTDEGDCGAGGDFLTIDPGGAFGACSFHGQRFAFAGAADLLAQYRARRAALSNPASRRGCARPLRSAAAPPEGVRRYRSFASNNSGDTVIVARFETEAEPRALADVLNELAPGSRPSREAFGEQWESLRRESVPEGTQQDFDRTVAASGRTLLATGYDAHDALATTRALLVGRGARLVHTAVHLHDSPTLLVGLGAVSDPNAAALELWVAGADEVEQRGGAVFATLPDAGGDEGPTAWDERLERVQMVAEAAGGECRAELVCTRPDARVVEGLRRTLPEQDECYFQAVFYERAQALRFADEACGTLAGQTVLVDASRFRPRLARRAQQAGGFGYWLPRARVCVEGWFSSLDWKAEVLPEQVQDALSATSGAPFSFVLASTYRSTTARIETDAPHEALAQLERAARHLGGRFGVGVVPADAMAHAIGRIRRDLEVLR